jgi:hypothetical protein
VIVEGEKLTTGRVVPVIPSHQSPVEEDESVELFFDQLWAVPQPRSARVSQSPPNLFWIHKDLWDSRSFQAGDCYPVQEGDVLRSDWKEGLFAKDF